MIEQKITLQELKERQNWTLEQKIDHAIGNIEQFYNETEGACVISFSGGKDSTVLLHLARRIYPEIKAVFVNTTNEFNEILDFVRATDNVDIIYPKTTFIKTVEKYGFPIVSKKVAKAIGVLKNPSDKNKNMTNLIINGKTREGRECLAYKLAKKWYPLKDAQFNITHKCCEILKHEPINRYAKENGVAYIKGTMADNSKLRESNYLQYGCNIFGKNPTSRPISIWTDADIWEYIKRYDVPYCSVYDKGEHNTGCAYCAFGHHLEKESRFERLREREPKRFAQMMKLTNSGVTYEDALKFTLSLK